MKSLRDEIRRIVPKLTRHKLLIRVVGPVRDIIRRVIPKIIRHKLLIRVADPVREMIRVVFPKPVRRKLIKGFVRNTYWYTQGNTVLASIAVIPIEKIAIGVAAMKYIAGDYIGMTAIWISLGAYFLFRIMVRWWIGLFWEENDGYTIQSKFNKGRVSPGRFYMVNIDELADLIVEKLKK